MISEELPKPDAFVEVCLGVYVEKVREAFAKTITQRTALADALKQAMAERDELRALVLASRPALEAGADSLLVEQTKWERRHYVTGLEADKWCVKKIGGEIAQLRTLSAYGVGK